MDEDQRANVPKPSPAIGIPVVSPPGIIQDPAKADDTTIESNTVLIQMRESLEAALTRADETDHKLGEIILILNNPSYRVGPMVDVEPIMKALGLDKIWKGY